MAQFVRSDLEFILEQIRISEAHAAGTPLEQLVANPTLPFGLRTVDGSYNNLVHGQSEFGASDNLFPRTTEPVFRPAENGTSYEQTSGTVIDSQPRTISNLIVDQSDNNPAAVAADDADGVNDDFIGNVTPDAGLSAPFNSWFTLFGQFFDHGLDLVSKGGGTVFIPLKPDDPLYVEGSPTNFMVLTRATNQPGPDGVLGTADDVHEHNNKTTPFVDQNQTYTSHPSHQVFLREYVLDGAGKPVSTGRLIENRAAGPDGEYYTGDDVPLGGLATWAVVKAQAATLLGIELTDADVTDLPLLATDPYGQFLRGAKGFPQLVLADNSLLEGNPAAPVSTAGAVRTGHAFLDDIAHSAAPRSSSGVLLTPDADLVAGVDDHLSGTYDEELLDAHYITGDGRGNENIGLTSVHHVFHSEHNRLADQVKDVVLATNDLAFLSEWLRPGTAPATFPTTPAELDALQWNGERVFQAARFGTEMQYQHLVFEEFARKVQPNINIFDAYETDINPAIVAEFAHVVYRFGHSMLTETVDRFDADGNPVEVPGGGQMGLIEAFLNPLAYAARETTPGVAAGEVVRGMTRQVGNEIDEFVTDALRNNLLGLPLDLATINLARGRDTGIPSLNAARREFFEGTGGDTQLRPYESWVDFGLAIKHPESLVNFIAAYGRHQSILDATTLVDKRAAALAIITGVGAPPDAIDFLNSTGDWASGPDGVTTTGLDDVDLWIGGLAEKQMPFGGLLGSTFNFVFETQLEKLQDGDRFYYLSRTAGLNFFTQLEEASFADMVMRNTGTKHLPGDVFSTPTHIIEASDPSTWPAGEVIQLTNGIRYTGVDHVVLGGTENNDRLISSEGDDTLYGDGGNDNLEGGAGNDTILGGDGDDILTDQFGEDVLNGGAGNDTIHAGPGLDLVLGGFGDDYINGGEDENEIFAGHGDDIIVAGDSTDEVRGNEGSDWFEGGALGDLLIGDNDEPFQLSTIVGHDVFIGGSGTDRQEGEHGDDIFVGGEGLDRHEGGTGYDWMSYERDNFGITADLTLRAEVLIPPPPSPDAILDRFRDVEGLSGSAFDDTLRGDDAIADDLLLQNAAGLNNALLNTGLISGLTELLRGATSFSGGNIILGGAGSDAIEGRGGDDFIDGDAALHVGLTFRGPGGQIIREIVTAPAGGDVDTAVFSEALANYTVVANGDGTYSVAHVAGTQADGTDTLRNIERLRFADQLVLLDGTNQPGAGNVTISDTTPTEDQLLSVSEALTDPNGVVPGSIQFVWQAETAPGVWTDVAAGPTFQPGDQEVGLRLRVMATFEDLLGARETVFSAPTAAVINVDDAPTGQPEISDTSPTEGQTLIASPGTIADPDGTTTAVFSYRWQVLDGAVWTDIPGATTPSFTPDQAQVGLPIRVVVSYTDDRGTPTEVASLPTTVVGGLLFGTAASDFMSGDAGDDDIAGGAGRDLLFGFAGNDTLRGQGSHDTLDGGNGADTLLGGGGRDILGGGDGVDMLRGNSGDDTLYGGAGNDSLYGDAGDDSLVGGDGDDAYFVDVEDDTIEEEDGGGVDTVYSTSSEYWMGANVENLYYIGDDDTWASGNTLANHMYGGGGDDTLKGARGADTLFGGAGDDDLRGGRDDDRLTGGTGDDQLIGADGNDTFVFGADFGDDRVSDFGVGQDSLDISELGITAATFASSVAIEQDRAHTVITIGSDTITLNRVHASTVTEADFILAV
jgi:Ca2+-binding RTX toxin-like protein